MATARDESGYGAGGKFKKRTFRRSTQTTPYDRPSTSLRNPPNININNNNGWLSKLVDPAQRLIVSSAHRLFASVFRKRLPPPAEREANHEETNMDQEQVSTDHAGVQGAIGSHDDINNSSDKVGLIELEQILKQKTFSRSEIDRLTALLQSRTTEMPVRDEQKSPEVILSKPVVLHNRKGEPLDIPFKENGIANQLISTPVVSSTVLDEDIALPTELAKAYMGSRPSKVSPSMLGVCDQAFRDESTVLSYQLSTSASSVLSLVPRSSAHVSVPENGFVTPRSRGRSAIYSMARAPHSRVHSTTVFKGDGPKIDTVAGLSLSSQSTWEKNRLTGSKQGSLKRRNTVLDTDIGSVGPIRRIRQKPNLLSSKSLSLAASGSPLSVQGSGVADTVQYPSSFFQKLLLPSEPKHGLKKLLTESRDNSVPSTSSTPIPSKSSEMASKILQQLDKLVSSREKSPTELSPSMLQGPALKSLENVDSSIFMENVQDNNRSIGSHDPQLFDVRDSSSKKQDKVEENGPTKIFSPKLIPAANGVDAAGIIKDNVPSTTTTDSVLINCTPHPQSQKRHAFQMSAHEDYLELDDDDYSNGPPSMPLAEGRDKLNASLDDKTAAAEAITVEKSPACSDVKEKNHGAIVAGKGAVFAFSTVPSPSMTVQPAEVVTLSTRTSNKVVNESSGSPIFSFGEKFASPKESNAVSPSFSTGMTYVDKVPQFTDASLSVICEPATFKFDAPLNLKPESSTSLASGAVGATDSVTKVPELDKADDCFIFRTPETSHPSAASTSSSTASIFSSTAPANVSTLNNGSLASCPSSTSSPTPPSFSSTGFNQNLFSSSAVSFATSVTTSSATAPSAAAPIFKFGSSSVLSTSVTPPSATSGIESTESRKSETSFGNSTGMLFGASSEFAGTGGSTSSVTSFATTGTGSSSFGTLAAFSTTGSSTCCGTSSATTGSGSSIFAGASLPITSIGNSSFGGTSTVANTGSSIFGFSAGASTTAAPSHVEATNPFAAGSAQASVSVTSVATTTQSMPTQFGSTVSSTSFGLAANPTFSSGSSILGSSTSAAKPFDSVPSFVLSSSASSAEANSISSSSGTTASVFGSSWQSPKTPLFVSTFNSASPSTAFSFGATASSATSSSAPVFGSSTNASSSSIFPFTLAATATSSLPAFGNAESMFAFSSAPSNNNDQMNMEDSMAEDTVPTSTPAVPAFGQQPISPPSSFIFGPTTSSGANPFPFGSQQTLVTPQNPSPFQASSSLDFNAGGSFSLGTGGGDKSQRRMVKVRKARKK